MEVRPALLALLGLMAYSNVLAATLHQHGISAPLRMLALMPAAQVSASARELDPPLRLAAVSAQVDTLAQPPLFALPSRAARPHLPHVLTGGSAFQFDGLRGGNGIVSAALGDLQYMQLAHGLMAVYSKDTGSLLFVPVQANSMFANAPRGPAMTACATPRSGATAANFDPLARRWIVSFRAWAPRHAHDGPYYQCIAVSATSDAGGRYYRYAMPIARGQFIDDPQLAVWPDALYLSVNLFEGVQGSYRGPRLCAIERQALLRGASAALRCHDLGPGVPPLTPASPEGLAAANPDGSVFMALDVAAYGAGERVLLWRFSFTTNQVSALGLPVAPFKAACAAHAQCIAQPMPGAMLTAIGDRVLPHPVYRNDHGGARVLACHAVQLDSGQLAVRWYEIGDPHGAARVLQQGSFAPDAASAWPASISSDQAGNIALGYGVAAADTPPGIRYTGRHMTDPPGRMQGEEVIFNGHGVDPAPAGPESPGGALLLDPVDGCTFWYTQRYLPSTGGGNWHTRVASFRFQSCRAEQ